MKKNINALAQIISDKLNEKNVKDIAEALWFEMQIEKRTGQLDYLLGKIREKIAEKNKEGVARIFSREVISDETMMIIKEKLAKKYDRKFELESIVDPSILGGIKIQIQDEVIDMTWREKLNAIKTRMVGANE